jgi:hypothetical protein
MEIGRVLIGAGAFLLVLGVVFTLGDKIPFIGKLPGDIYIKRDNFTFYFPVVTSIIISIVLSLLFGLFRK